MRFQDKSFFDTHDELVSILMTVIKVYILAHILARIRIDIFQQNILNTCKESM